jgi:hypothetical protein
MKIANASIENKDVNSARLFSCIVASRRLMGSALRMTASKNHGKKQDLTGLQCPVLGRRFPVIFRAARQTAQGRKASSIISGGGNVAF